MMQSFMHFSLFRHLALVLCQRLHLSQYRSDFCLYLIAHPVRNKYSGPRIENLQSRMHTDLMFLSHSGFQITPIELRVLDQSPTPFMKSSLTFLLVLLTRKLINKQTKTQTQLSWWK